MKISGGAAATAPQRRRDSAAAAPRRHDAKKRKKTVRKPCKTNQKDSKIIENGPKMVCPPPEASISWSVEFQPRFRPAPVSGSADKHDSSPFPNRTIRRSQTGQFAIPKQDGSLFPDRTVHGSQERRLVAPKHVPKQDDSSFPNRTIHTQTERTTTLTMTPSRRPNQI